MKLTFMGATGTVTGSKFLVESGGHRVLVDCGLFQGLKKLRERNWSEFPVEPSSIDSVVLTHAHIDHTGYLPRLVSLGFNGTVYATAGTIDLANLLLPDAAHLQEEEARFRNRHGYTKHHPALPLYTDEDARAALALMEPVAYGTVRSIGDGLSVEFLTAGHILGSAFVRLREDRGGASRTVLFTGDIGRFGQPILKDPVHVDGADYVVLESTYGNRLHEGSPGKEGKAMLGEVIRETVGRGGSVLIPSFAIGRAQEVLYILRELEDEKKIPVLPVFVDSPMAINAFDVFRAHPEEHDRTMRSILARGKQALETTDTRFTRTPEESMTINDHAGPCIIVSASGMATGGRILHHLVHRLGDERNTIVFVGFQAAGTRGRTLLEGATSLRIFGIEHAVRARVTKINVFSAHADYGEILSWLEGFDRAPATTFLVHGEPAALEGMASQIGERFKSWKVRVPEYLESVEL